jgi:serine/threonine-protein kinase RsbW
MSGEAMGPGDVVRLTLPASTAFVGVARSLAAGLATRLDFDLDHVEDLRLAVSEACSVVLPEALPGSDLGVTLLVGDGDLTVHITTTSTAAQAPPTDSFAWTVLNALADDVAVELAGGRLTVRLHFVATSDPQTFDTPAGAELS